MRPRSSAAGGPGRERAGRRRDDVAELDCRGEACDPRGLPYTWGIRSDMAEKAALFPPALQDVFGEHREMMVF